MNNLTGVVTSVGQQVGAGERVAPRGQTSVLPIVDLDARSQAVALTPQINQAAQRIAALQLGQLQAGTYLDSTSVPFAGITPVVLSDQGPIPVTFQSADFQFSTGAISGIKSISLGVLPNTLYESGAVAATALLVNGQPVVTAGAQAVVPITGRVTSITGRVALTPKAELLTLALPPNSPRAGTNTTLGIQFQGIDPTTLQIRYAQSTLSPWSQLSPEAQAQAIQQGQLSLTVPFTQPGTTAIQAQGRSLRTGQTVTSTAVVVVQ
ncbi:hypothetical protein [Anthocerotibacter panamensis]|uniref:hypothetical protein n=1 Tax=Anthocerotibacter panamensis TaxID=2857077 RepID=UPI001C404059|nr:hypothetical protein [Anthocerotibacter panamensis]